MTSQNVLGLAGLVLTTSVACSQLLDFEQFPIHDPGEIPKIVAPECGNAILDRGEQCDEGEANSDRRPNACRRNCALPDCGDGVVDEGEACDEGPATSASMPETCLPDCTLVPSGHLRLAGPERALEVFHEGEWRGVCDDSFGVAEATVACRQLGLGQVAGLHLDLFRQTEKFWLEGLACTGAETALSECPHQGWANESCGTRDSVGLTCSDDGAAPLRLSGAHDLLEVYWEGEWVGICPDGFDRIDAYVACRQLGYGGVVEWEADYQTPAGTAGLSEVDCTGTETGLSDCPGPRQAAESGQQPRCEYGGSTLLRCDLDWNPPLRLSEEDRVLELLHDREWRGVCDTGFDVFAAQVACRQLGYPHVAAVSTTRRREVAHFGLSSLACEGSEPTLGDCQLHVGPGACSSNQYVSLNCTYDRVEPIRLAGPDDLLEIYHDDKWGALCEDGFDQRAATAACRQLGFARVVTYRTDIVGSSDMYWIDDIECYSGSYQLRDCIHREWGQHDCDIADHVSVRCSNRPAAPLRLIGQGGDVLFARQEDEWLAVCDAGFDATAAHVACLQLGYSELFGFQGGSSFENENFWLQETACDGGEAALSDCFGGEVQAETCQQDNHVRLQCNWGTAPPLRTSGNYNILEVFVENRWRGVCGRQFDQADATVACRQLGYAGVLSFSPYAVPSSVDFALGNLECTGSEQALWQCAHTEQDHLYCGQDDHVSLLCGGGWAAPIRVSGPHQMLEVMYQGEWRGVCDDGFGEMEATVACRQLGFSGAHELAEGLLGPGDFWLDDLSCTGGETALANCQHRPWGEHDCSGGEHVSLRCLEP